LGLVWINPGNLVPPVFEPHTLQSAASCHTNCATSAYGNLPLHNWKVQKEVGGVEKYFTTMFSGELWF